MTLNNSTSDLLKYLMTSYPVGTDARRQKTRGEGQIRQKTGSNGSHHVLIAKHQAKAMRVLIIDDDDIIRELLSGTLQQAGYKTCQLPSPIGATKKIISEGVNVVVLDVMMPEISGDKLAKMLRGNAKMGRIGIVLISSLKAAELHKLKMESGADAVVEKERMHTDLVSAVRKASTR